MEILNILDDHSRLAVGSAARTTFRAADVVDCFYAAGAVYGYPAGLLTDNAAVFTARSGGAGWVALERVAVALGIRLRHPRPYHPQTCGKVERFHGPVAPHRRRPGGGRHTGVPGRPTRGEDGLGEIVVEVTKELEDGLGHCRQMATLTPADAHELGTTLILFGRPPWLIGVCDVRSPRM